VPAAKVDAPLIDECYANLECRLFDSSMINKHSLFIFEVAKAHVRRSPRFPKTLHYRGAGLFMISGPTVSRYRKGFKPDRL
jgi:flavin reductase (DIM6/NTAB) family NADH-FMN oxidoreductase RutF